LGEQYFLAYRDKASLTIALQDDPGFEDYDYWLTVELPRSNQLELVSLGKEIARILTLNGFAVSSPFLDEDLLNKKPVVRRIVYLKKESNDVVEEQEDVTVA
jgi:hypothetical protein